MAERDEKELVLGNKQLISLFFVAVALCGVFFALGYMIGHNASKGSIASLDAPAPASTEAERPNPAPAETQAATATEAAAPPAESQTFTQPAREPQPAPSVTETKIPATVTAAAAAVVKPEAGATYVQVTALHQADAQNLVKTLREQNLPATIADSSKPDLFRVLVGPYHQTADVADAKAKLKALGFANAFVQKQ